MAPAYKADQLGSFLRPASVKEARARFTDGTIDAARLAEVEDAAILDSLAHQKRSGVDVFSDGELRRAGFQNDLMDSVDGYVPTDKPLPRIWQGPGGEPLAQGNAFVVGAKIVRRRRLTEKQATFLRAHAPGPFKMTVPSANQFPALGFMPGVTDKVYPTRSDLLWAIAAIIKDEITALADEGVPYIQIDAPRYSYFVDPKWREYLTSLGEDPDKMLDEAVEVDRYCFEGAKRNGVTTALHICRGNNQSKWYAEGGYEPLAEKLFGGLGVDRLLLEYDTDRAGTFEPLRFVPEGTVAVLGLVSSKVGGLESKGDVLRRIGEAAKYVPLDRLALSPQCGFASMAAGNLLTEDQQWRKVELVVETAREVWGS
jgi:5-methyltetrahydropteroyltriglutamate--homocysteine methyltransferase